jgi:hypothetical protein
MRTRLVWFTRVPRWTLKLPTTRRTPTSTIEGGERSSDTDRGRDGDDREGTAAEGGGREGGGGDSGHSVNSGGRDANLRVYITVFVCALELANKLK